MIKRIILKLINIYQETLSLDHGWLGRVFPNKRNCKFTPTCSMYSYGVIDKYGVFKGGILSVKRILKCNPWATPGQYDPIP